MSDVTRLIESVADARELARRRLPKSLWQTYDMGNGSAVTGRANLAAFEEVLFRPHNAVWNGSRDQSTTVLGHEIKTPVLISSIGQLKFGHTDGEAGVARAAGAAGTIMFLSSLTSTPVEEVVAAATGPVFYQLYYFGGREASEPVLERVKRAGVDGLVLNVDAGYPNQGQDRLYTERARLPYNRGLAEALRFAPQVLSRPTWLAGYLRAFGYNDPPVPMSLDAEGRPMGFYAGIGRMYAQAPVWDDIPWIRERWQGPLVVKGILRADDARRAVAEGADAIVVGNHGGNYLDGSMPSLRALPEIVAAVGDEVEVLMDSGVRRGIDVLRAMSLGARAVLLGRAYMWGHLAAGEAGVSRMLEIFRQQIDTGLGFLGVESVRDLDESLLDIAWAKR